MQKLMSTREKSQGFSTLQVVAALAIAGTLTAAAANVLLPMYQRSVLNNAYEELYLITNSIRQLREYTGSYSGLTNFASLTTKGYLQSKRYTNGTGQNVYGNNITAVSASSNTDVTLTYTTATAPQCENLKDRSTTINGIKTSPAADCGGGTTLTLTVD